MTKIVQRLIELTLKRERGLPPKGEGFALVATLLMVLLLTVVTVAISSKVMVETHSAANTEIRSQARHNAMLGLEQAMNQLQVTLGPDQRISATSNILTSSMTVNQPYLTGVWQSLNQSGNFSATANNSGIDYEQGKPNEFIGWLVSLPSSNTTYIKSTTPYWTKASPNWALYNSNSTPLTPIIPTEQSFAGASVGASSTTVLLVGPGSIPAIASTTDTRNVYVNLVNADNQTNSAGVVLRQNRFGWWVGDEGVKAKINQNDINLVNNYTDSSSAAIANVVSDLTSMPRAGIENVYDVNDSNSFNSVLSGINIANSTNVANVITPSQMPLATVNSNVSVDLFENHFHDFTVDSSGVLADVKYGGLKRDMSLLLEQPAFGNASTASNVTANPATQGPLAMSNNNYTATPPNIQYMPMYQPKGSLGAVWDHVYRYYNRYKEMYLDANGNFWYVSEETHPTGTGGNQNNFNPSANFYPGCSEDWNNPYKDDVEPIITKLQTLVSLTSLKNGTAIYDNTSQGYQAAMVFDTYITCWNPYNVYLTGYKHNVYYDLFPMYVKWDGTLYTNATTQYQTNTTTANPAFARPPWANDLGAILDSGTDMNNPSTSNSTNTTTGYVTTTYGYSHSGLLKGYTQVNAFDQNKNKNGNWPYTLGPGECAFYGLSTNTPLNSTGDDMPAQRSPPALYGGIVRPIIFNSNIVPATVVANSTTTGQVWSNGKPINFGASDTLGLSLYVNPFLGQNPSYSSYYTYNTSASTMPSSNYSGIMTQAAYGMSNMDRNPWTDGMYTEFNAPNQGTPLIGACNFVFPQDKSTATIANNVSFGSSWGTVSAPATSLINMTVFNNAGTYGASNYSYSPGAVLLNVPPQSLSSMCANSSSSAVPIVLITTSLKTPNGQQKTAGGFSGGYPYQFMDITSHFMSIDSNTAYNTNGAYLTCPIQTTITPAQTSFTPVAQSNTTFLTSLLNCVNSTYSQGFYGNSDISANGQNYFTYKELPVAPLVSIAQLQHAPLGRNYNAVMYWMTSGTGWSSDSNTTAAYFIGCGVNTTTGQTNYAINNNNTSYSGGAYSYQPKNMPPVSSHQPIYDFAVGNSYSNPILPSNVFYQYNMGAVPYLDQCFASNEFFWDSYYFSTLTPQTSAVFLSKKSPFGLNTTTANRPIDQVFADWSNCSLGHQVYNISASGRGIPLPNQRLHFYAPLGEGQWSALQALISGSSFTNGTDSSAIAGGANNSNSVPSQNGFIYTAKYQMLDGAFNINSTSVDAWQAILMGLNNPYIPLQNMPATSTFGINNGTSTFTAASGNGTISASSNYVMSGVPTANLQNVSISPVGVKYPFVFSRFTMPNAGSYDSSVSTSTLWQGVRSMNVTLCQTLATNIVSQIQTRGPFLSLSEFVNRQATSNPSSSPSSGDNYTQDGILQSAIDSAGINNAVSPNAIYGTGYLTQADLLTPLGSIIAARSDTFLIRAYGDVTDASGNPLSRAWCEATVQRLPDYFDPSDPPEAVPYSTTTLASMPFNVTNSGGNGEALPYSSPGQNQKVIPYTQIKSEINNVLGRRFKIVRFRWLNEEQI